MLSAGSSGLNLTGSCQRILQGRVQDPVPIRTSFAVMERVAEMAANRTFVEIGSRHGDLIECVSHFTRGTAVSIEGDSKYCGELARRASLSTNRWTSTCAIFSRDLRPVPQAELYFTWVQHFLDVPLLNVLYELQRAAMVPEYVEFAMGFSGKEHLPELNCFRRLSRFATRFVVAPYHEHDRLRGRGKPIIGVFRPSQLNMTQVELAARGVCHKGNPLTAPNSSTFYSDYKGNPLTAPNSSTFYSDSGRR